MRQRNARISGIQSRTIRFIFPPETRLSFSQVSGKYRLDATPSAYVIDGATRIIVEISAANVARSESPRVST